MLIFQSFLENNQKPKTNKPINMVSIASLIHLGRGRFYFQPKQIKTKAKKGRIKDED